MPNYQNEYNPLYEIDTKVYRNKNNSLEIRDIDGAKPVNENKFLQKKWVSKRNSNPVMP